MLERLIKILTSTPEKEDDEEKIKTNFFLKKIVNNKEKCCKKHLFRKKCCRNKNEKIRVTIIHSERRGIPMGDLIPSHFTRSHNCRLKLIWS